MPPLELELLLEELLLDDEPQPPLELLEEPQQPLLELELELLELDPQLRWCPQLPPEEDEDELEQPQQPLELEPQEPQPPLLELELELLLDPQPQWACELFAFNATPATATEAANIHRVKFLRNISLYSNKA